MAKLLRGCTFVLELGGSLRGHSFQRKDLEEGTPRAHFQLSCPWVGTCRSPESGGCVCPLHPSTCGSGRLPREGPCRPSRPLPRGALSRPAPPLPPPRRTPGPRGGGLGRGDRVVIAGPARGPPNASRLSPAAPDSAQRADPAPLVAGPPSRAAVDTSALAWGPGVRTPARGPGASRRLLPLLLLLLPLPTGAWYKHVASPRYHTVGRAAGLLMGLRRSPYVWRRALPAAARTPAWDALAPAPAARNALLLSPGLRERREAPRWSSAAARPVHALRSPSAPEELRLDPSSAEPARYVRERRSQGFPGGAGGGRATHTW